MGPLGIWASFRLGLSFFHAFIVDFVHSFWFLLWLVDHGNFLEHWEDISLLQEDQEGRTSGVQFIVPTVKDG